MNPFNSPDALTVPWVESPFIDVLLGREHISPESRAFVEHFAREGYGVIDLDVPHSLLDEAAEGVLPFYRVEAPLPYSDERRAMDGWLVNEAVKKLATLPQVLDMLRFLYRREPVPFQTINFCVGSEQRTHSDTIHFHSLPHNFMCGVWIALEDVDENNGPLHYYPRSHKLPVYEPSHLGVLGSREKYQYDKYPLYEDFVEALMPAMRLDRVNVSLKKGQAFIWAANLFHGGTPIADKARSRHTQVTHYFFNDCVYYTPLLSDPLIGKLTLRDVVDIRTNDRVKPVYHGLPFANIDDASIVLGAAEEAAVAPVSPASSVAEAPAPTRESILQAILGRLRRGSPS